MQSGHRGWPGLSPVPIFVLGVCCASGPWPGGLNSSGLDRSHLPAEVRLAVNLKDIVLAVGGAAAKVPMAIQAASPCSAPAVSLSSTTSPLKKSARRLAFSSIGEGKPGV